MPQSGPPLRAGACTLLGSFTIKCRRPSAGNDVTTPQVLGDELDRDAVMAGQLAPMYFCSAFNQFGVDLFLVGASCSAGLFVRACLRRTAAVEGRSASGAVVHPYAMITAPLR